ncbi:MAG TPA: DNA polymerase Y family protein, partial [Planctomycetaceae bacterium]|nr:DNA polymerase Y family protein [Planctomycetaceae bacterium]
MTQLEHCASQVMSTKRTLCIWLPNWPLQRLIVAQPELRQHPVILAVRNPRRGQYVAACCEQARQHGIHPDMPLSEATSLCHDDLQVYPYDTQEDLKQLQHLARSCDRFSPRAGIECVSENFYRSGVTVTDQQPQSLLMEITGTDSLFGSEQQLVHQIILDFHRQGYSIHLAIAATLGAAWGLAHFARPQKPPGAGSW